MDDKQAWVIIHNNYNLYRQRATIIEQQQQQQKNNNIHKQLEFQVKYNIMGKLVKYYCNNGFKNKITCSGHHDTA